MNFSKKLIGNNQLINKLFSTFNDNNLSNSLIFYGEKGIGKATLTFYFINKIFQSLNSDSQRDKIENLIYNNTHPNIRYIQRQYDDKNDKFKNHISIDQIRSIENFLFQSSFDNLPKFIIIDAVDNLNLNSSNALLKVLEEPKLNNYFILLSHQFSKILPTIRSRCINFKIDKPNVSDFVKILNLYDEKFEVLNHELLYNFTNGSPGLATEFNSDKIEYLYDNIIEILINNKPLTSQIINLADTVGKFTNDEFSVFLMIIRFILMSIVKTNLGYKNNIFLPSKLINYFKDSSLMINNNISIEMLEYLNNNENDLFIYNLDKKIFCLNIFNSLNRNL